MTIIKAADLFTLDGVDGVDISDLKRLNMYETNVGTCLLLDMNGDYLRWWNADTKSLLTSADVIPLLELAEFEPVIYKNKTLKSERPYYSPMLGDIVHLRNGSYGVVVEEAEEVEDSEYPIRLAGLTEGYYYLNSNGVAIDNLEMDCDIVAYVGVASLDIYIEQKMFDEDAGISSITNKVYYETD